MKIKKVEQNTQAWLDMRKGKITGSKLHGIYSPPTKTQLCAEYLSQGMDEQEVMEIVGCTKSTVIKAKKELQENGLSAFTESKRKIGFYNLMAEILAEESGDEPPMERGLRLESEAIELFEETTGKKVEVDMFCISDENESIALSPDGLIKKGKKYTEGVEVKCLSSARHLEAYFEKEIPSEYKAQAMQYFIVNDDLQSLHFTFYDPRIASLPMHMIEIRRKDIESEIVFYKKCQVQTLEEVNKLILELSF